MKKHTLQILMIILLQMLWQGSLMASPIVKYLQKDFGAYADGVHHDDTAFIKASHFFNDSVNYSGGQTAELIIESTVYNKQTQTYTSIVANYLVGIQLKRNTSILIDGELFTNPNNLLLSLPLLFLKNNVNGLTIQTDNTINKPIIKYADSLYFGAFAPPNYTFGIFSVNCNSINPCIYAASTSTSNSPSINCNNCNCDCDANIAGNQYAAIDTLVIYTNNSNQIEYLPPSFLPYSQTYDATSCSLGTTILINGAKNVTIKNIEINGNNENLKWGSTWDDFGIQLPHRGVYILGDNLAPQNIRLENMHIHHMGLDGVEAINQSNGLTMKNCVFEYNSRQGFSWSGGNNLVVDSCKFNYTGQAFSNTMPGTRLCSAPGAGIDIEPVAGAYCNNGMFSHCEFINNKGCAILSPSNNGIVTSNHFDFKHCKLVDIDDYGIWFRAKNTVFDSCEIYCRVTNLGFGDSTDNGTKFSYCKFEDKPYNGEPMHGGVLFNINYIKKIKFIDCSFKVNDKNREFFWLNWHEHNLPINYTIIDNCSFEYNNLGQPCSECMSNMQGVVFKNRNSIKNILNGLNSYHGFKTMDTRIEGNNDACNPSILEFEGQVEHYMVSNDELVYDTMYIGKKIDGTEGYAKYIVKNKALSAAQNQTTIYINAKSKIEILENGSIYPSGRFLLNGQFIAHKKSYVGLEDGIFYGNNSIDNLFYIDKLCNQNLITNSPVWSNGIGYGTGTTVPISTWQWIAGLYNSCAQGGHPALSSVPCANIYTQIATGNTFTLLYNHNATCFGNSNNNVVLDIEVKGGIPPYHYSIDGGVASTNTQFANLNSGNHTITVSDAYCTESFVINLEPEFKYTIVKGCYDGVTNAQVSFNSCVIPIITGPSIASFSGNVANLTAVGTYTITAAGSNGAYTTTIYIGDCSQCTTAAATAQWFAPSSTTSDMFPSGIVPSTPIVLDGNIDVDNVAFVFNNPAIYLAENTELVLNSGASWVSNSSTLKGCNAYWKGIKADGNDKIVIVNNGSTIEDMSEGVLLKNNAFLQATNSIFKNNASTSIGFENMTLQTNSQVWNNTFTSDANMIAVAGQTKPKHGVEILNSNYINIGDETNVSKGSTFTNLYNGIKVYGDGNISGSSNEIGIYNNTFEEIDGVYLGSTNFISHIYDDYNGSGIFIDYSAVPNFVANTIISCIDNTTFTNGNFLSCKKAIVNNNSQLIAKKLTIKNCGVGIMNNNLMNREIIVDSNKIDNCFIGAQLLGNYKKYAVSNNEIKTGKGMLDGWCGTIPMNLTSPIAIDLKHFSNVSATIDTLRVENNILEMPYTAGRGVSVLKGSQGLNLENNLIKFTATATNQYTNYHDPSLYGVFSSDCQGMRLKKNVVDGISDSLLYSTTYTKGMYFENSPQSKIECNKIRYTKQGLSANGNCETDSTNINNNKFKYNLNPLYTSETGTPQQGTFGQIGTDNADNNNDWLYNTTNNSWLLGSTQKYKVWHSTNSIAPLGFQIKTISSLLTQQESGSSNGNQNPYPVTNNTNSSQDLCPDPNFLTGANTSGLDEQIDWTKINLTNAEEVALQEADYINFYEVGEWMNTKNLFEQLSANPTLVSNSSILNNFYDNYKNTTINAIQRSNVAVASLFDFEGNHAQFLESYDSAVARNSRIISINDYEINDRTVNTWAMQIARYGQKNFDDIQKMELEALANMCPFVGGDAVYRARTLWAMYNPLAQYNDRLICLNASNAQNKSSQPIVTNIDSLNEALMLQTVAEQEQQQAIKEQQQDAQAIRTKLFEDIIIYPNPATDYITISTPFYENGKFVLFNMLNEEILKIDLINNTTKIKLPNVSNGTYMYKIIYNNDIFNGKITIKK